MSSTNAKKTPAESALAAVRTYITSALEALKEEAEEPAPGVVARVLSAAVPSMNERAARSSEAVESARNDLSQAELALKTIESALGELRHAESVRGEFKNVDDQETREWLTSQFERKPSCWSSPGGVVDESDEEEEESKRITGQGYPELDAPTDPDVAGLLELAGTFEFDALRFSKHVNVGDHPIAVVGAHLERKRSLIERMRENGRFTENGATFRSAFLGFLNKIDSLYKPDAIYHSNAHALDVMSTSMWFMQSEFLVRVSKPIEECMALVAAAIHDVGHPGVNNLFLTKTGDSMALRYNDRSVLESMHVALAFETMHSHADCNWFKMLDPQAKKIMRPGLISMVLATDMATHSDMQKKLGDVDKDATTESKDLKFILETVLHASDISNPAKPTSQMLGWTKRITEEFWSQGDEEQRLSLEISPLCERASGMASVPKGQIGFINFVVKPYFTAIVRIIPEAQKALDGLSRTVEHWEKATEDNLTYEQIFADTLPMFS